MSIAAGNKVCIASYLGIVPYDVALKLQHGLMRARAKGGVGDVLLLLQHSPVLTVGRFRGGNDIIVPREMLAQEGIAVIHTSRGGGITYHGPGQLVGYPILNLKEHGLSVRGYIAKLEETIMGLLLALGIEGRRMAEYPGVWVRDKKVCSIGIHISRHTTMHGFALNVTNDLRYFRYVRPCGLPGEAMTSVSELFGHQVTMETVIGELLTSFSEVFGLSCKQENGEWLATLDAQSG